MQSTYIRPIALIVLTLVTGVGLKAQNENTSERLITQLKNGTAPGLQFSAEKPALSPSLPKQNEKEGLISQIRKGTAAGMKFRPVSTNVTTPAALRTVAPAAKQPLASEQPVGSPVQTKITAPATPKQD